jgi:hypothetical protein
MAIRRDYRNFQNPFQNGEAAIRGVVLFEEQFILLKGFEA